MQFEGNYCLHLGRRRPCCDCILSPKPHELSVPLVADCSVWVVAEKVLGPNGLLGYVVASALKFISHRRASKRRVHSSTIE